MNQITYTKTRNNIMDIRDKFKKKIKELAGKSDGHRGLKLNSDISLLLYSYQRLHLINLINSMYKHNIAFDGSATGTGKTYTAIALCKQLRISPIIVCPKSSRSTWKNVCNRFKVEPKCIVNYELLRNCKMYDNIKDPNNPNNPNNPNKKVKCPFISKDDNDNYIWTFENPKYNIIIFDEAHQCKNQKSQLGKLLLSAKKKCKILLLSATLYDKINDFVIFGYLLGLYKSIRAGLGWIKWVKRQDEKRIGKFKNSIMHEEIFPSYGSRMDIEDLGENFPKNIISTDCYDIDTEDAKELNINIEKLQKRKEKGYTLSKISKIRCKIEKLKVPVIIDEILKYYESGKSVVVFVNFIKTLNRIEDVLKKTGLEYGIIKGGQTAEEREKVTELFQYNRIRIIVCTIQSGGESISLHDKFGKNPRVSLISPSMSSIDIIQAIGRIYRTECKTPCLQKIMCCAGTYEEKIAEIIKNKINDISKLTDDDLFTCH